MVYILLYKFYIVFEIYALLCPFLDVNECDNDSNDCDANADCINTQGNFTCVCQSGYVGDGRACVGNIVCMECILWYTA